MISAFGVVHKADARANLDRIMASDEPLRLNTNPPKPSAMDNYRAFQAKNAAQAADRRVIHPSNYGLLERSTLEKPNLERVEHIGKVPPRGETLVDRALKVKHLRAKAGATAGGVILVGGTAVGAKKLMDRKKAKASISKGRYSDDITRVQSHRQKANRRRAAGGVLLGGGTLATTAALANPEKAALLSRLAGNKLTETGNRVVWNNVANEGKGGKRAVAAGIRAGKVGMKIAEHPGHVTGAVLGGTLLAGAGVAGAGMAHNARSNQIARKYNKTKANSKIKIVPVSGKNRF